MVDLLLVLKAQLVQLRRQMKLEHGRTVAVADLITDRWERAAFEGWGTGTSCYDSVLVLGEVSVGEHTWIGPNCILDVSGGGLQVGSHCSISAGVQIYTHDTVERTTSMGVVPRDTAATRIGSGVYLGPNAVVSKGVTIGDRAVVGAMSFVNTDVPEGARVWGCPARPATSSS
jgi:acetyltransferase-like isoleucine patch superfamily enzyme